MEDKKYCSCDCSCVIEITTEEEKENGLCEICNNEECNKNDNDYFDH